MRRNSQRMAGRLDCHVEDRNPRQAVTVRIPTCTRILGDVDANISPGEKSVRGSRINYKSIDRNTGNAAGRRSSINGRGARGVQICRLENSLTSRRVVREREVRDVWI